jgi:DNA/RNA-binding domain of Phe-tRNA-synthetase-like protein
METGVPVWALDADRLEGEVGLRGAERGERLGGGEYAHELPAGRLVLADGAGPVGVLFGALAPGRGVDGGTTRITLLALQVAGVPDIHAEEALWTVADILGEEG